jgi:hypothetical protein
MVLALNAFILPLINAQRFTVSTLAGTSFQGFIVTTLAGTGFMGLNNGPGPNATFIYPAGVAVDSFGNLYVADYAINAIRMINSTGYVSTLAGTGSNGFTNGPGPNATFSNPISVAVDSFGNLYVADLLNLAIRKLYPMLKIISVIQYSSSVGSKFLITINNLCMGSLLSVIFNLASTLIEASNCILTNSTISCYAPPVPFSAEYDITVAVDDPLTGVVISLPFSGFQYDSAVITSIAPNTGTGAGGDNISISGINFGTGCCVTPIITFGSKLCTSPVRVNDSLITCVSPAVIIFLN